MEGIGRLLQTLPAWSARRGRRVVVKLGGSAMNCTALAGTIADIAWLAFAGQRIVVVHGGGKPIDRALAAAGMVPQKLDGRRITDDATLAVVVRVLGTRNQRRRGRPPRRRRHERDGLPGTPARRTARRPARPRRPGDPGRTPRLLEVAPGIPVLPVAAGPRCRRRLAQRECRRRRPPPRSPSPGRRTNWRSSLTRRASSATWPTLPAGSRRIAPPAGAPPRSQHPGAHLGRDGAESRGLPRCHIARGVGKECASSTARCARVLLDVLDGSAPGTELYPERTSEHWNPRSPPGQDSNRPVPQVCHRQLQAVLGLLVHSEGWHSLGCRGPRIPRALLPGLGLWPARPLPAWVVRRGDGATPSPHPRPQHLVHRAAGLARPGASAKATDLARPGLLLQLGHRRPTKRRSNSPGSAAARADTRSSRC